jgi:hypothetical protein
VVSPRFTTPSAPFEKWLRIVFLMAQPPLLCKEGNSLFPSGTNFFTASITARCSWNEANTRGHRPRLQWHQKCFDTVRI